MESKVVVGTSVFVKRSKVGYRCGEGDDRRKRIDQMTGNRLFFLKKSDGCEELLSADDGCVVGGRRVVSCWWFSFRGSPTSYIQRKRQRLTTHQRARTNDDRDRSEKELQKRYFNALNNSIIYATTKH